MKYYQREGTYLSHAEPTAQACHPLHQGNLVFEPAKPPLRHDR